MPTARSSARTRLIRRPPNGWSQPPRSSWRKRSCLRPGVAQLEAATVNGSVFVVRDGGRLIAATTTPEPTVGLVFYDLKTCLRSVEAPPKRKRRAPAKKTQPEEADDATA